MLFFQWNVPDECFVSCRYYYTKAIWMSLHRSGWNTYNIFSSKWYLFYFLYTYAGMYPVLGFLLHNNYFISKCVNYSAVFLVIIKICAFFFCLLITFIIMVPCQSLNIYFYCVLWIAFILYTKLFINLGYPTWCLKIWIR